MKNLMRHQTLVGLFVIAMGALIFLYWILLPVPEKEKLIREIYNIGDEQSALTESTYTMRDNELGYIFLSKDSSRIVVAQNYSVGKLVKLNEVYLGNFRLETSVFKGPMHISARFNNYNSIEGVYISFLSKCENCKIRISVNNHTVFTGIPDEQFKVFVPKVYLKQDNILRITLFPSLNPLQKSTIEINNLVVEYVTKNKLVYEFYYYGGKAYLLYDFCPVDPLTIKITINKKELAIPSCSSYKYNTPLMITSYLKTGKNIISIDSDYEVVLKDVEIEIEEPKIFHMFKRPKDGLLYMFILKGRGILRINNCTYYITPQTTILNIKPCLIDNNLMVLEADPYIEIERIIIT